MARNIAVIGAAFGDEGKGLITDYYAAELGKDAIVVRFNGGAQAGHTVVTPEGKRHVFSHFGSGTLLGNRTVLAPKFIVNPILFREEWLRLEELGVDESTIKVLVDRDCLVTTPYDMMMNQLVEGIRDKNRHGSCGVGINETVTRSENEEFSLMVHHGMLGPIDQHRSTLEDIRENYLPARIKTLLPGTPDEDITDLVQSFNLSALDEDFLRAWEFMMEKVDVTSTAALIRMYPDVPLIFEGAQGLLLDEYSENFPHVTRSRTGLPNVVDFMKQVGRDELDVVYVTRAYMTRHGAGPFSAEDGKLSYYDDTNVTNPHQGSLRFGHLNTPEIAYAIALDYKSARYFSGLSITPRVAITHLDQVKGGKSHFVGYYGDLVRIPDGWSEGELADAIITSMDYALRGRGLPMPLDPILTSYGPTRDHVSVWDGDEGEAEDAAA